MIRCRRARDEPRARAERADRLKLLQKVAETTSSRLTAGSMDDREERRTDP